MKRFSNDLRYELVRKIAEGGMGIVYEGFQLGVGDFRSGVLTGKRRALVV